MLYPYIRNADIFDCPSYAGITYIAAYALWECGRGVNSPRIVPFVEYGINEVIFGNQNANNVPIPTPLAKLQRRRASASSLTITISSVGVCA